MTLNGLTRRSNLEVRREPLISTSISSTTGARSSCNGCSTPMRSRRPKYTPDLKGQRWLQMNYGYRRVFGFTPIGAIALFCIQGDQSAPRAPAIEVIVTRSLIAALTALCDKPAGTIRITTFRHAARIALWPALQKLLPEYPDIAFEISIDEGTCRKSLPVASMQASAWASRSKRTWWPSGSVRKYAWRWWGRRPTLPTARFQKHHGT